MKSKSILFVQLRAVLPILLIIHIQTIFIIGILGLQRQIPVSLLTSHPSLISDLPFYTGLLSNISLVLLCATATICFFSDALLKKIIKIQDWPSFFRSAGLLTLLFLFDNLFNLNQLVFPKYFKFSYLSISILYLMILFLFTLRFLYIIVAYESPIILLGILWFSLSILAYVYLENRNSLFENGARFLWIIHWFTYWLRLCFRTVRSYL